MLQLIFSSVVLFLVLSAGSNNKKGVVHSLWCATKLNFCGGRVWFFAGVFSGIGSAGAPQLRSNKYTVSPHNHVHHLKPTLPLCYRVVSVVHGVM